MSATSFDIAEEPQQGSSALAFVLMYTLTALQAGIRLASGDPEQVRAGVLLLLLTPVTIFIFQRAARSDPEATFLLRMLVLAWVAKLLAMEFRLYLLFNVYHGADTVAYHEAATAIAATLASGGFPELTNFWGTEFVELVAGVLYFFTGPSMVGAWVVFGWLGLLGMLLHYKAFALSLVGSNRRLYMALLFFYPSILMWTGSLGKDALSAFFLGVTAYGVSALNRRGLTMGTLLLVLVGPGGVFLVRPHLAAIVAVALTAVMLARPIRAGALTPIIRIAGFGILAGLAFLVIKTSASFLNIEDLSFEGVTGFIQEQQEHSSVGGSAFEGGFPTTPQALGLAIITVLFRPFLWEAGTGLGLISALEGTFLLLMLTFRLRNIFRVVADATRNAYLAFSVFYAALFVVFFSAISNFGILVRQRVQLLPFILIWLAYRRVGPEDTPPDLDSTG